MTKQRYIHLPLQDINLPMGYTAVICCINPGPVLFLYTRLCDRLESTLKQQYAIGSRHQMSVTGVPQRMEL